MSETKETAAGEVRERIYIASKTRHAKRWLDLRAIGIPIISTWIDEAEVAATDDWPDLWDRCVNEAKSATRLIVYAEPEDFLKGALVEIGAALGAGVPVFIVGDCPSIGSFRSHRLVRSCNCLDEALSGGTRGEITA